MFNNNKFRFISFICCFLLVSSAYADDNDISIKTTIKNTGDKTLFVVGFGTVGNATKLSGVSPNQQIAAGASIDYNCNIGSPYVPGGCNVVVATNKAQTDSFKLTTKIDSKDGILTVASIPLTLSSGYSIKKKYVVDMSTDEKNIQVPPSHQVCCPTWIFKQVSK